MRASRHPLVSGFPIVSTLSADKGRVQEPKAQPCRKTRGAVQERETQHVHGTGLVHYRTRHVYSEKCRGVFNPD